MPNLILEKKNNFLIKKKQQQQLVMNVRESFSIKNQNIKHRRTQAGNSFFRSVSLYVLQKTKHFLWDFTLPSKTQYRRQ